MSGNSSDDYSEGSSAYSGSTAISTFAVSMTPPSLDECLFQPPLFFVFLRYLMQFQANENLVFLKQATVFSMLRRPLREKYLMACKIIWAFMSDSSPSPLNISAENRKKLLSVLWRKDGIGLVNDSLFDDAIAEIKLLLTPMFNKWVDSGEWQKMPFFHANPPTVAIILRIPSLRTGFQTFLAERREEISPPKTADVDCKLFDMCIKLHEVQTKCKSPDISAKEAERTARHFLKAQKSDLRTLPVVSELEMPKLVHHKKTDDDDLDGDLSCGTCVDFVAEALDTLCEELMERECYEHFIDEKSWKYVDVLKASLQQTLTKDGFCEYPTLAAVLHSPSYGPLIMDTLKGTEKCTQMKFLLEAQDFYTRYSKHGRKLRSQEHKEMILDARRIFDTYYLKNDLELPKRIKNEVLKVIHSPTGRMNYTLFQLSGAWIYNKIANSWVREVNSVYHWADHDYDNNAADSKEMERIFDISLITSHQSLAIENLDLVPHPDDVLGNPKLMESFVKYVPTSELTTACFQLMHLCKEIITSPPEVQGQMSEKISQLLTVVSKDSPQLTSICDDIHAQLAAQGDAFNPGAFMIPGFLVAKMILTRYYSAWLSKNKSVYKQGGWVSVPRLTFAGSNAIPGTSWIPSVGIDNDVTSKSMPDTKRKWSLVNKIRSNSSGESGKPAVHKNSGSYSPVTKLICSSPKDLHPPKPEEGKDDSESLSTSPKAITSEGQKSPSRSFRVPGTVNKSIPVFRMEVPTICDTLTSSHLRRLFFATFLEYRLGDDEKKLWMSLSKFQADFSQYTDAEVVQKQKSIREAAMKVLEANPRIPEHDNLVNVIKQSKYNITSKFFFDAEVKLYELFHSSYQSFLANNQWVRC